MYLQLWIQTQEITMITVGIRELKQQASALIRQVTENGGEIQITLHGKVVALLIPVERPQTDEESHAWASLDQLAAEIGARWPAGVSAVEAVAEGRR
jgi:prevent-host-death family protein